MGWLIRVGRLRTTGFEQDKNAGVITCPNYITSNDCHIFAQTGYGPNADKTTSGKPGSNPGHQVEQIWWNVLSTLVGMDE